LDCRKCFLLPAVALTWALSGCSSQAPQAAATQPTPAVAPPQAASVTEVTLSEATRGRVVVAPASTHLAPEVVEATGRIIPAEERTWRLGAVVEGRFEKTAVEAGDRVKKDQWLAGMHSHDIHDSRADYRRAVSEKQRAEENLAIAIRQRDRAKRLFELKAGSSEQVDAAEAEVVRAQASVRAASVEVERVYQHITEVLQVSIVSPEEDPNSHNEDLIPIKAPEAGVVLKRLVTTGTVVNIGQELFVIADLSKVLMVAQVPEAFLGRLRVGQAVTVNVQSYPDRQFPGRIERLAEELDPETRTIQVRIALANPGGVLKPESYAKAAIPIGAAKPAVFIATSAVQDIDGASSVFVQSAPGKFDMRPVALGRTVPGTGGKDRVEVTDGLSAGEMVAVEGAFLLKSQLLKARLGE
jgi:membrane fusion protein, heavy metal efflux system